MTIEKNDTFPDQKIRVLIDGEMQNIQSSEYLSNKKVVLVGVPGAFTPTCHSSHLPRLH
jgi:peroxiredoxin